MIPRDFEKIKAITAKKLKWSLIRAVQKRVVQENGIKAANKAEVIIIICLNFFLFTILPQ